MEEDIGEAVKWASNLWKKENLTLKDVEGYYAVLKEYYITKAMTTRRNIAQTIRCYKKAANAEARFNQAQQVIDLYSKLAEKCRESIN